MRNKLWLVLCAVMIICLIITLVDIFIFDIPFIYGNEFGLTACIIAIICNLINYFTN